MRKENMTSTYLGRKVAYLLMPLLVLTACKKSPESASIEIDKFVTAEQTITVTKKQFEKANMQLDSMQQTAFFDVVHANGKIDVPPQNNVSVSTYFGGVVKDINVLPGQSVRAGKVLFTIENVAFIEMQEAYLEAKGQLAFLESDYERQKKLYAANAASEKTYRKAESMYLVTKAKYASLNKKLQLLHIDGNSLSENKLQTTIQITSPTDGYVTKVEVTKGSFLNPSETAVSIVNTDHMHVELQVFEKDVSKLEEGQPIEFTVVGDPGKIYRATVKLVNHVVDDAARTIGVHGHLDDENPVLRPGMYVDAKILSHEKNLPSLPKDAVMEEEGKSYVLVKTKQDNDNVVFVKKEIKLGRTSNTSVEILNAEIFDKGAEILVNGGFQLIGE